MTDTWRADAGSGERQDVGHDAGRKSAQAWVDSAIWHARRAARGAAIACYRRALTIEPRNAGLLTDLARVLEQSAQPEQAFSTYRAALEIDPEYTPARRGLAQLLQPGVGGMERIGQLREEARRLHAEGRLADALARHREALRIAPQLAGIWLSAGMLADAMGEQWTSLLFFEEAVRLDAGMLPAIESARRICVAAGLYAKAVRYSQLALALHPSDDIKIAQALLVASIQTSLAALHANRRAYLQAVDGAIAAKLRVENVSAAVNLGNYFLAYHGQNDAVLQRHTARLFAGAIPDLSVTAAHCGARTRRPGRIRLGIISRFLFSHSIGATTRGLVAEISRDRFEVFLLRITPSPSDAVTQAMRTAASVTLDLDPDFRAARRQIAALELDVLFYQDIGMEPTSYLLAFSRLAPVQCVSFGHPNTTGIPTLDYFISNDLYEPPEALTHYTEKLFMLHDLPTLAYYHRPAPAAPADRLEFGLHRADHVYLCPQALCKLHPEFDPILAAILQRDPDGIIVLLRGGYPEYADQLHSRLCATLCADIDRVLFLDAMPFPRFMQLLASADVCLDTLHFNGMNSSLEALSLGIPIVTLPGRLQRGRHTQAMYRKMGVLDCIAADAADYVAIAVRLGTDAAFSQDVRKRIRARSGVLFEDRRVIEEFERFFLFAVNEAYAPDGRGGAADTGKLSPRLDEL